MPRPKKPNVYTEAQRIKCVALLVENGGFTYEGIMSCQDYMATQGFPNFPKGTLQDWYAERKEVVQPMAIEIIQNDPQVSEVSQHTGDMMYQAYVNMLQKLSDPEFVKETKNMLHIATSFGILEERMRLHIGLSTEIINLCKRFVAVVTRKGFDPLKVFEDLIESWEQEPDVRGSTAEALARETRPQEKQYKRWR
jgi:hypothetical protein